MATKKKEEEKTVAVVGEWKPKAFNGTDLLPYEQCLAVEEIEGVPLLGEDKIDPDDLVLPVLALLHGTSAAVTDDVPDAVPGKFMHTGTEEVVEGPVRLVVVHYHKGNALFPKEEPRYEGVETCISPDGVEGTVYGDCKECGKCFWPEDGGLPLEGATSPLGAEVHHFVALSNMGPVIVRFSRSSYKAGSKFLSAKSLARKNYFAHPAVVRVVQGDKTLPTGKVTKFFALQMAWQTTEKVPAELQVHCAELYKNIDQKHETGNLKSNDEEAGFDDDIAL